MPNNKTVAERIKKLRKKQGLTQYELAQKVGVSVSAMSMYETGERIPRDKIKVKIASALGKSIEFIFFNN